MFAKALKSTLRYLKITPITTYLAPTQMLSLSLTLHFWTYTFSMATAGCTGRACAGGFLGCAVWLRRNSFAVGASST